MASVELSRRVAKVVAYPSPCEMEDVQRREFHEALLDAGCFEDLPGEWQAAIAEAEQSRPKPRAVSTGMQISSPLLRASAPEGCAESCLHVTRDCVGADTAR